jgi:hypothetical protein
MAVGRFDLRDLPRATTNSILAINGRATGDGSTSAGRMGPAAGSKLTRLRFSDTPASAHVHVLPRHDRSFALGVGNQPRPSENTRWGFLRNAV